MMKLCLMTLFWALLTGLIIPCFAVEVQLESFDDLAASGWYELRSTGYMEQEVNDVNMEGTGSMRIKFEEFTTLWDEVPRKYYPGKIDLTPDANTALSFWVWSDLVGSSRVKQLIIYQTGNTARFDVPIASETGWQKIICPVPQFFHFPPDGDTPIDDFSQIDTVDFWCSTWPSNGNSIYIDDLRIISDNNGISDNNDQYSLPRVEAMSNEPSPYLMRDWLNVTQGYVDFALDETKTGTYLPLLSWITSGDNEGMFIMPAYVNRSASSTEAVTALPLIISGTLVGYDMTNYNGHDTVTGAANMYYCASQQMADNGPGCGNPEFWYKMLPTIFLVQLADLYPGEGDLPNKVNAIADKLYDASVVMIAVEPDVDDVANADIGVQGTVSGSYTDTQNSDGSYEEIMERESTGNPDSRYSYLEHKWTIDVTGGDTVTFYVEAHHTANSEGDDFVFAYSTDDSTYTDMLTVTKTSDDSTYQSYVLPGATSGTVYLQVKDTNQTPGNKTLDTVYVDHMFIRSIGDPCVIPNYNYKSFNFSTMTPVSGGSWVESGSAAAFAWISYMAYTESGEPNHLTAADWGMSYLSDVVPINQNPLYEIMLRYGPITAARMNAELGRSYDLNKLLYWCSGYVTHQDTYSFRVGWGTISSTPWGGYDCDGLAGSVTDSSGYAFAMNIFQSASTTIPVVRYDSDYARTIGKWMLNLANAARLLYPSFLDSGHQYYDAWEWAILDGYDPNSYIAYEGLRRYKKEGGVIDTSVTPYATGDYGLRLGLYGSSSVGYLGSIIRTTNVEKILQWDCLKTDFYHDTAYPTYLYFNPYGTPQTVSIDTGSNCVDLYDTVSQTFLKTDINGVTDFNIPADSAVVIVLAPAGGEITISGNKKLINDVVVDYKTNTTFSTCAQIQASPLRLPGDITGDCIVDINDLIESVEHWLNQGVCLGRVDIGNDGTVSFIDVSKLARDWLVNNSP